MKNKRTSSRRDTHEYAMKNFRENKGRKPTIKEEEYKRIYGRYPSKLELKQYK